MSDPITQLNWRVASSGYHWVKTTSLDVKPSGHFFRLALGNDPQEHVRQRQGWFITDGSRVDSADIKRRSYSLFDDCPSLFREFLRTSTSRPGIQAFANRFGLLGGPRQFLIGAPDTSGEIWVAELFEDWKMEIDVMAQAADCWEALQQGAIPRSSRAQAAFPKLDGDPLEQALSRLSLVEVSQQADLFAGRDTITASIALVQLWVNMRLDGLSPRLFWSQDDLQYRWRVVPKTLLAGLWFEFAESVSRRANFSRCENCGSWFEISDALGNSRKRKRFCRDLCRVQAHRKKPALSANTGRKKAAPKRRSR